MIHHYTSIQSLALILESKKIRFTRIDRLDDIKEIDGFPSRLKQTVFVSCWTEDDQENISLWSLYTQMKGVRISLPKDMFNKYFIKAGDYGNWGFGFDIISPLPLEKIRTDEYLVSNPFWLEDGFYKKITYSDSFIENRKNAYNIDSDGSINIKYIPDLFIHKDLIWAFQRESRFYLIAFQLPPINLFKDREIQMLNIKSIERQYVDDFISNIDVELNNEVLNNIIVRLSPTCSNADRIIVESLLHKHTTNGGIENSNLKNTFRSK
jgi:hypothetical protein